MKTVCRVLGVARSHVHEVHHRSHDWQDARKDRTPKGDAQLLAEIRQHIAELPSYGYRRACALVNRQRAAQGEARVNPKRAYRVGTSNFLRSSVKSVSEKALMQS